MNISDLRLRNQHISSPTFESPEEVVAWLGAQQAQDYAGALWSIALRMRCATIAQIENAVQQRTIVRTWPMRGTLHFVPAADIHWMLRLMTARPIAAAAQRRTLLGLDSSDFIKCEVAFIKNLEGGRQLSRDAMYQVMEEAGVAARDQRGMHIIRHLAMVGLLCFGSHEGKQPSFALLDEWCPVKKHMAKDEALAELAKRYYLSHGPATLDDFVRWSGLTVSDARTGLDLSSAELRSENVDGQKFWSSAISVPVKEVSSRGFILPGFDEFMLGYKSRSASLSVEHSDAICPGSNGMFLPTVVIDGQVVGTWSRTERKNSVVIRVNSFDELGDSEINELDHAATRYGHFIGKKVTVTC